MIDLEWYISQLVPGGDGFSRLSDGRVGFVAGTLPGERVRVSRYEVQRGFVRALDWDVIDQSPERILPPCSHARECGGCDWMHMSLEFQRQQKVLLAQAALRRVGKLERLPAALPMIAAGAPFGYRNRVRFQIDTRGRLGFYARHSRKLVPIRECLVIAPELARAFPTIQGLSRRYADCFKQFSELELRAAPEQRVSLRFVPRRRRLEGCEACLAELRAQFLVAIAGAELQAAGQRFAVAGSAEVEVPASAFTQVNRAVNEELVAALLQRVLDSGVRDFCELYAGAGNFTLPLLAAGLGGVAIEVGGEGLAAARRAAEGAGFQGVTFRAGDVALVLDELARAGARFDLILLDPPRTGARAVLPSLLRLAPAFIAYCSCDPVTLARDLGHLTRHGFVLQEIIGFDMFPQTHHFELLAWLGRDAKTSKP